MKVLVLSIGALLFSGCTQLGLGVANLPAKFSDTRIEQGVAFGPESWQRLDIYRPAAEGEYPVVVFFYGGRWSEGSRTMYPFVGEAFAERGYITVIADYRKYPEVRFPTFVEDGAQALAWVHDHIETYGGVTERVYLAGHSAGAHIASLLVADERYLAAHGKRPDIVRAFAGLAGPYDFVPNEDDLIDMFGPPERYPQMQTTTFIDGNEPPMLLLWGEADTLVYRRNIDLLAAKVNTEGGQVVARTYDDMGHVGILSSLTWLLRDRRPVFDDVLRFFERH